MLEEIEDVAFLVQMPFLIDQETDFLRSASQEVGCLDLGNLGPYGRGCLWVN